MPLVMATERPVEPHLTPEGAFVIQVRTDSDLPAGRLCGRVEHVTSGRSDRFSSLDELMAFIARHVAFEEPETNR
jgi:hypothetical protein